MGKAEPERPPVAKRSTEREGRLADRVRFLSRYSLLIVDEIGYPPVGSGGGNLFFQLVNACYERCAMIMTGNRGFGEWVDIFGDAVGATALLERLLHHAVVIPIEGNSSYRLREHADLIPEQGQQGHTGPPALHGSSQEADHGVVFVPRATQPRSQAVSLASQGHRHPGQDPARTRGHGGAQSRRRSMCLAICETAH